MFSRGAVVRVGIAKMELTNTFGMRKDLGKTPVITTCPNCKKTIQTEVESEHRPTIVGKWCLTDLCGFLCNCLKTEPTEEEELHRPDIHNQHTHRCPSCGHTFEND